jgi:hypothetical protein
VPENSCLKYNGQEVDLCNCGSVDVNSVRPVSVRFRVRELVVSSQGQSSAFAVSVSGSDLEVSNHQGAMAITKGGSVLTTLSSSVSKSFAGLGCADPSVSHATAKQRTAAAGTAAAGTATAWTLAALSAPAALSAAMLARSSNRVPLSSLKP